MVRTHRRRLGLSQEELAERAGLGVRSIGKLEAGQIANPRPVTVRLLADAFGLAGADRDRFCEAASGEPATRSLSQPQSHAPGQPRSDLPGQPRSHAPGRPRSPAPAQLPADVAGFTGRADDLRRLTALLDSDRGSTAVLITAIAGTAGVGKTALAVHWAHQVRHHFPDGQLYVNLRGFDPTGTVTSSSEAVRRFLDALGVAPQRIPADPDAQVLLYRSLVAERRMLMLLDNARDADQVRPLLPGAPGCIVVVTSRNQLTGLVAAEGAQPVLLDLLTVDEARDLLTRRLGADRTRAEPGAVDEIIVRCARLPLALAIVAARAATRPDSSLAALAVDLDDAQDRLDALTTGDPSTDIRTVFSWSYRTLTTDSARLFRLLGLHPGPDISVAAAASLAGLPDPRVRQLLAELARAHLIDEHAPGRYTFHDLLRAYGHRLAHAVDGGDERRAAVERMLAHYLHTAYSADRLMDLNRDPITLAALPPGTAPEEIADPGQALAWFTVEHRIMLGAIEQAAAAGHDTYTWQLAWTMAGFLDRSGRWLDYLATQRSALAAADRLDDRPGQARVHRLLAGANSQLGRYDEAHLHLEQALRLYRRTGDMVGQAHAHRSRSLIWEGQGRYAEALHHGEQALALYRAAGHKRGQASALNGIGWDHAILGDYERTLAYCQQALTMHESVDDPFGQADCWDSLGYAHHHLGDHAEAIACYRRALDLFRSLGGRFKEAKTRANLGDAHLAMGDREAARAAWKQALAMLDLLDRPEADAVRAKLDDLNRAGR
jgi:tetratricopeptide (TPR) repeat protein/DNA-binding XRE family transcriptional regulator